MTRPDWIATLRAEVRPADPDPALLAQLVELSRGSAAPAARPSRSAGARLAIVLGGAIAVGATSWAAGALPGTESPFRPEEHVTRQPADPLPGRVATPGPEAPATPVDDPSGPGDHPASPAAPPGPGEPALAPGAPSGGGHPPGAPPSAPSSPSLPTLPTAPVPTGPALPVPTAPLPPGLAHVPPRGAPLPLPGADDQGDDDQGDDSRDSDSGGRRIPRPQEAQVATQR